MSLKLSTMQKIFLQTTIAFLKQYKGTLNLHTKDLQVFRSRIALFCFVLKHKIFKFCIIHPICKIIEEDQPFFSYKTMYVLEKNVQILFYLPNLNLNLFQLTWCKPRDIQKCSVAVGYPRHFSNHLPSLRQSHLTKNLWKILVIFYNTRNLNDTKLCNNNPSILAWHKSQTLQIKSKY